MTSNATPKSCKYSMSQSFHPFQLAFSGISGAGKTTLISKLLKALSPKLSIGFVKRDAHTFTMDKEGKDTYKAWESGAQAVQITDRTHSAFLFEGQGNGVTTHSALLDYDTVFIEGYKNSTMKKIVLIDEDEKIFSELSTEAMESSIAFVGKAKPLTKLPEGLPYFQRDDIEGIANFILNFLDENIQRIPLYGLLLAGGYSTRMKEDKALLKYAEKSQAERGYESLLPFCDKVFISSREEQWDKNQFPHIPKIYDRFRGFGPLGGILTAMASYPKAAWLVLACDLPYLDEATLQQLVEGRNPLRMASAFMSAEDALPEPLCAIYEPKSYVRLLEFLGQGYCCPRKILGKISLKSLKLKNNRALENINHREDYLRIKEELHSS